MLLDELKQNISQLFKISNIQLTIAHTSHHSFLLLLLLLLILVSTIVSLLFSSFCVPLALNYKFNSLL